LFIPPSRLRVPDLPAAAGIGDPRKQSEIFESLALPPEPAHFRVEIAMSHMNLDMGRGRPAAVAARARRAEALEKRASMPLHVFLRLFVSAVAAALAIYLWRRGER
jgi:hypothetical protein